MRWLLLSDLHFKHNDLDRVRQTAQWIVSAAERYRVKRVVVCGDLLTSRKKQETHVLSACYRFIGRLSDAVPRVHILLGNHDLAYLRDYQTTALDALNLKRLAPYVSLHSSIARHEWDGRRVLLLPFREEQGELTEAVAALGPDEASKTVAFGHLAINKAITQRYVVKAGDGKPREASSITYRGLTGPDWFASLARTFTGHFHSHQTIVQKQQSESNDFDPLQGSVTYLGSPLQLGWADLYDEQRGVVLFDPETLEHELLVNPHAVGYTTADIRQVLDGQVDADAVADKHVMILGELGSLNYIAARDKLFSLGVRNVRSRSPLGFTLRDGRSSFSSLGASVPASDAAVQLLEEPAKIQMSPGTTTTTTTTSDDDASLGSDSATEPQIPRLDLAAEAREYVEALELDESLGWRRDELVRVGQRMIQASREMADPEGEADFHHRDFLDGASHAVGTRTSAEPAGPSSHAFVAEPRTLTITNFLGVCGTLTIDFRRDIGRGLTFLVGDNGSGKSTLVEAMVWCQFGKCIRSGLGAKDVINDIAGKNCSVVLEFANGYTIARHRTHKSRGYRVIVSLRGEPQPQFEQAGSSATQKAINELLGTDFETYIRTVVLSHESATSFLNSTMDERRELIEASLGLSMLDQCGRVAKLLLKDIDGDVDRVKGELKSLRQNKEHVERNLEELGRKQKRLQREADKAVASLKVAVQEQMAAESRVDTRAEPDLGVYDNVSALQEQLYEERENLKRLKKSYARIHRRMHAKPTSWLGQLQQHISQHLEAMSAARPTGLRKLLHVVRASIVRFQSIAVRGLLRISGIPRGSTQDDNQEAAKNSLREDVKNSMSRLQTLGHEVERIIAMEELAINHAVKMKEQLTQVIQAQKMCHDLQQQATLKQDRAATYTDWMETEQTSLHALCSQCDTLAAQEKELSANRELFAFWSSALAKPKSRASSSSSSARSAAAKAAPNFRELMLVRSLSELNALLEQVLVALYDGTRQARLMTAGMLRSLFDSDTIDAMIDPSSGPALARSLVGRRSLAYGKCSSGERKRVDLALFFAMLQLSWARSSHRAHYVLIDEVFDSLDEAGQAAIVRWCGLISPAVVGQILLITHSRFLMEEPGGGMGAAVMTARKGARGTELVVDGRRLA